MSEQHEDKDFVVCTLAEFNDVQQPLDKSLEAHAEHDASQVRDILRETFASDVNIARDMAYFGETNLGMLMQYYKLSHADLQKKLSDENFVALIKKYKAELNVDPKAAIRIQAEYLLQESLPHLFNVVRSASAEEATIVKAVHELALIANAIPKPSEGAGASNGMQVTFNFGTSNPLVGKPIAMVVNNEQND